MRLPVWKQLAVDHWLSAGGASGHAEYLARAQRDGIGAALEVNGGKPVLGFKAGDKYTGVCPVSEQPRWLDSGKHPTALAKAPTALAKAVLFGLPHLHQPLSCG